MRFGAATVSTEEDIGYSRASGARSALTNRATLIANDNAMRAAA